MNELMTAARPTPPHSVIAALIATVALLPVFAWALALPGGGVPSSATYWAVGSVVFAVLTVRRNPWPWIAVVLGGVPFAVLAVTSAIVAARGGDHLREVAFAGAGTCGLGLVIAYLRRPARAWHGYACPRCGAFRWPMQSRVAQTPCNRCDAAPT
jgi:hypothetical protein